jgi:hypothetical protein
MNDSAIPSVIDEPIFDGCALCLLELRYVKPEAQPNEVEQTKRHCIRCRERFCPKHVSPVSPLHCIDCRPLVVHEELFERTDTHESYNEITDKVEKTTVKEKCVKITFEGPDKDFYAEAIALRSIEELKGFVKYHKAIVSMMEEEILHKTIKQNTARFKLDGVTLSAAGINSGSSITAAKPKKPKIPKQIDPTALAALLKQAGIDPKKLAEQLKAKGF